MQKVAGIMNSKSDFNLWYDQFVSPWYNPRGWLADEY